MRESVRTQDTPGRFQVHGETVDGVDSEGRWAVHRPAMDMTLDDAKAVATSTVKMTAEQRLAAMVADYPPNERETWAVQVMEAEALTADPDAAAPFLRMRAQMRGADPLDFAAIVLTKNTEYRQGSAAILGHSDVLQAQIEATTALDELRAIDLNTGWPE